MDALVFNSNGSLVSTFNRICDFGLLCRFLIFTIKERLVNARRPHTINQQEMWGEGMDRSTFFFLFTLAFFNRYRLVDIFNTYQLFDIKKKRENHTPRTPHPSIPAKVMGNETEGVLHSRKSRGDKKCRVLLEIRVGAYSQSLHKLGGKLEGWKLRARAKCTRTCSEIAQ